MERSGIFWLTKPMQSQGIVVHNKMPARSVGWTTQYKHRFITNSRNLDKFNVGELLINTRKLRGVAQEKRAVSRYHRRCRCSACVAVWQEFCENTSLHGLKFVGRKNNHFAEKIFWLLAFILAALTAAYFIVIVYNKWDESPVIVSVGAKTTKVKEIPLPAVTICPHDFIKKHARDLLLTLNTTEAALYRGFVKAYKANRKKSLFPSDNSPESWSVVVNAVKNISRGCDELIESCSIGGRAKTNCDEASTWILTDNGICCSVNNIRQEYVYREEYQVLGVDESDLEDSVDWTPEEGYPPDTPVEWLPRRPSNAGPSGGLSIKIRGNEDMLNRTDKEADMIVMVHSPLETPKVLMLGSLRIERDMITNVKIEPKITLASPTLRSIDVSRRYCFFESERYLRFYRTYTQTHCSEECKMNITLHRCGCIPPHLRVSNESSVCDQSKFTCATDAVKAYERGQDNVSDDTERCNCLPACNDVSYSASVVSAHYYMRNVYQLYIYFAYKEYHHFHKAELYGLTEFLASTGGLLGLFIGFSVISLVEVLYFLTVRLCQSFVQDSRAEVRVATSFPKYRNL